MVARDLSHWRSIEKITVEQAGLLIAGVDPFDVARSEGSLVARARTFELAIREASERALSYAHRLVHRLDQEPIDPWLVDVWEQSDSFDRFLPSIELRQSVAEVLKDPVNVPLLVPVDPGYTETVYAGELNRWLNSNGIASAYDFPDGQAIVICDRGLTTWEEWRNEGRTNQPTATNSTGAAGSWPWGKYETNLLRKLSAAAQRFWVNYDPGDATTAPTNEQVIAWLESEGVARRTAEVIATILRVDGLPTGPRK